VTALEVKLGEVRVGVLERFEDDEEYRFSFDRSWLEAIERPVLGQFFEDRAPSDIVTSGIPCWFAHLLPQGPILRMIAREAGVDPTDYFDILRFVGTDLPGAVVMTPAEPRPYRRASAQVEVPLPRQKKLRFAALAGAQWKLSVHPGERGLVVPVEGGISSWIAKFHSPSFKDLPRVEFATMSWAKESGIQAASFRLGRVEEIDDIPTEIPKGNGDVFLIERFDRRPEGARIHMEDFGQVLGQIGRAHV